MKLINKMMLLNSIIIIGFIYIVSNIDIDELYENNFDN